MSKQHTYKVMENSNTVKTNTITLEFDNEKAAHRFFGWWLDGGGEQEAYFDSENWDKKTGYIRVCGTGIPEDYFEDSD